MREIIDSNQLEWARHPKHPGSASETDAVLSLHRVRVEPGGGIALHTHENQTEILFLLSGEGVLR